MKMTEGDLIGIIKAHRADSVGGDDGDLSNQRADAMDRYHGRPYGDDVVGRSQITSRDLAETVDWALPAILRPFIQSGELGKFDPVGPEDEQGAEQESDYVNQVMMKDNPGFMVLHDVFKDTMILKNGYTKRLWDTSKRVREKSYTGLTMDEVTVLMHEYKTSGAEVEIVGAEPRQIEMPGMPQMNEAQTIMAGMPLEVWDLKLKVTTEKGRALWMAVPVEEVRVSRKCRGSLQDSPFVEHVTVKTRSDLLEMGMPESFVDDLPAMDGETNDSQRQARDSVDDESSPSAGSSINDRSMDEIQYCEAYVRVDWDGDGIAELRKVVTCADRIPPGSQWNEPIEACALTGYAMKRVPHRHVGESFYDELEDLQKIRTTLERQLLDNVYFTNNSEKVVNERVNLKDFLTSQPGGIKRVRGDGPVQDSVMPLVATPIIDKILPVLDYVTKGKEVRTGIRPGSDMDPDLLRESTKGAFLEHLNRASQKIELLTRMLSETGVKEDFQQMHALLQRHQDKQRQVKLKGKWVQVNPREWEERTDMTTSVGLGTGNEEEKRQKLMLLSQLQVQVLQAATQAPPQVYARLYALFEDISEAMGVELPEQYAIPPNSPEYQQMQQMLAQKAQSQPNPDVMKVQQQGQLEQQRMAMQQETDRNRQAMEAQQQQAKLSMERELAIVKAGLERELEEFRIRVKAESDQMIAQMNNAAKLDAAQITAQTTLTAQQEAASDNAAQD